MATRQRNESALADKIASLQRLLQARGAIQSLLEVRQGGRELPGGG